MAGLSVICYKAFIKAAPPVQNGMDAITGATMSGPEFTPAGWLREMIQNPSGSLFVDLFVQSMKVK
jgi:hypothetical protein